MEGPNSSILPYLRSRSRAPSSSVRAGDRELMAARSVLLLAISILLLWFGQPVQAQTSQEVVKATFVYRFASFVTWPQANLAEAQAPIRLCVVGADPFAQI